MLKSRKILLLSMVALLTLLVASFTFVSGVGETAGVNGPSEVTIGQTFTITVDTNQGVFGIDSQIDYDAAQLEMVGMPVAPDGWEVYNYQPFHAGSSVESTRPITVTFRVKDTVTPDQTLNVFFRNTVLTGHDPSQSMPQQLMWTGVTKRPLSSENRLQSLSIQGAEFDQPFHSAEDKYYTTVPFDIPLPLSVTAVPMDPNATVDVQMPELVAGSRVTCKVSVTAETGDVKTYLIFITCTEAQTDTSSSDCTLSLLEIPECNFSVVPDKMYYNVTIPSGVQSLTVNAVPSSEQSTVEIYVPEIESGMRIEVTVLAANKDTYTYVIFGTLEGEQTDPVTQDPTPTDPIETDVPLKETQPMPDTDAPEKETREPVPSDEEEEKGGSIFQSPVFWIITVVWLLLVAGLTVLMLYYRKQTLTKMRKRG